LSALLVVRESHTTYGLGILNEGFRHSHLPFLFGNASIFEDSFASGPVISLPNVIPSIRCSRRQKVESLNHLGELGSVGETGASDPDILLQTEILDLMQNGLVVVLAGRSVLVGLDGSDVGRLRLHQVHYQSVCGFLRSREYVLIGVFVQDENRRLLLTLILSPAVGGRFFESGSGRSGNRVCKN